MPAGTTSAETDDLDVMTFRLDAFLTREALAEETVIHNDRR